MAIFTTPSPPGSVGYGAGDKVKVGSEYDNAVDAQAAVTRVEPLITVDQLKDRYLFGIPLVAPLPDPLTKKRAVMSDEMLRDAIVRAVSTVEAAIGAGFHIIPTQIQRRLPFDRAEYMSLGFFRIPETPILRVSELKVKTADGAGVYEVPCNWLDPGQFKKGQISVIPLMPASLYGGSALPASSGGAAWIAILGNMGWVASYWTLTAIVGFEEGHIPMQVNEAVGLTAAIDVLGKLAALYRVQSYSTGLDSASQSVSTAGVALYDNAIQRMQDELKSKVNQLKGRYYKRIFVDNV
jgi:hypothetical protein